MREKQGLCPHAYHILDRGKQATNRKQIITGGFDVLGRKVRLRGADSPKVTQQVAPFLVSLFWSRYHAELFNSGLVIMLSGRVACCTSHYLA